MRRSPLLLLLVPAVAVASGAGAVTPVLAALVIILVVAKLGGSLAIRLGQPAVLGELVAGLLAGNLRLLGFSALDFIGTDPIVDALASLGVILLLFEVGLESTVRQMMQVGASSLLVATLGVVAPTLLGFGVGAWLLPDHSWYVHLFLGAALCATSVGITARVFKDIGQSDTPEARIVLGAAVIDDVMGLVVLAAVGGIIAAADRGVDPEISGIAWIVGKAVIFLFGSVVLGGWLAPRLLRSAARLRGGGVLLGMALAFCFLLSWIAAKIDLAPIVGAFAAGLILEGAHYKPFTDKGEYQLEQLVHPVTSFLAPVFFVLMGFKVDLGAFLDPSALGLAAARTAAASLGTQVCMFGVLDRGVRRTPIGFGMIPRGEVGLIFANIGLTLHIGGERVIDTTTFTAIVIMVMVTTLVTPPLLTWSLRRGKEKRVVGVGEAMQEMAPPAE